MTQKPDKPSSPRYRCQDCGFGGGHFEAGRCPACKSSNIKRATAVSAKTSPKKTVIEWVLLIVLWACLLYGLWLRYGQ